MQMRNVGAIPKRTIWNPDIHFPHHWHILSKLPESIIEHNTHLANGYRMGAHSTVSWPAVQPIQQKRVPFAVL